MVYRIKGTSRCLLTKGPEVLQQMAGALRTPTLLVITIANTQSPSTSDTLSLVVSKPYQCALTLPHLGKPTDKPTAFPGPNEKYRPHRTPPPARPQISIKAKQVSFLCSLKPPSDLLGNCRGFSRKCPYVSVDGSQFMIAQLRIFQA